MNIQKRKLRKLNYKNDDLLSENEVFVGGYLNLYGALFKKKDVQNNKKGEILKKCPYIFDDSNELKELIYLLKDRNFITLRQAVSDYLCIKRIRKDSFCNWLNKSLYPFPLVRVICYLTDNNI